MNAQGLWRLPFGGGLSILIENRQSHRIPSMIAGQYTILVVEDELLLLDLLKEMLEGEGYRVITATDGIQAVNLYRTEKEKISLVLSDMGLPSMGGWEVLHQLKEINPKVKVILSSGFMDTKVRHEMIQSGAKDFIQKPYTPEKVIQQIRASILTDDVKPSGS